MYKKAKFALAFLLMKVYKFVRYNNCIWLWPNGYLAKWLIPLINWNIILKSLHYVLLGFNLNKEGFCVSTFLFLKNTVRWAL